jgi:asparagine synthase (glutamine-hydrolysing)
MSFLVVFNSDCAGLETDRLKRMNPKIAAQKVHVLGREKQIAFVILQPRPNAGGDETHCVTIHERFWLIGRVRLDGREALCSVISGDQTALAKESDALIILRAYTRWGDRCLAHLNGDFCFALWDEDRQQLLCGRDQLGVRPLFYAMEGKSWLVSDSLEIIAAEEKLIDDLDDYWIADFLTSGFCRDADRTVYKQIKRLPSAHYLRICSRACVVQKYWTLEIQEPIYYRHPRSYVEHFREVLALAINDRLPQNRVGISMSGGIDSSTLAARTLEVMGDASKIVAHTCHFEHLMPDEEKTFSSLVANKLGIQHELRAVDDCWYDPHWYDRELRTPEPTHEVVKAALQRKITAEMSEQAQVWFYGEGPDNALLFEWESYLRWLFKKADWYHLCDAIIQYVLSKQAREWRSTIAKYMMRRPADLPFMRSELPEWLNQEFVKELKLIERVRQLEETSKDMHPWHPRAIASFTSALWSHFLEQFEPSNSGTTLTWRHPYLDLRVLTFLLSVPPIPWARRKRLIRKSMGSSLPRNILSRDKAPLRRNPETLMLQKYGFPPLSRHGPISRYIEYCEVPKTPPAEPTAHPLINVYVLDSWLKSRRPEHLSLQIPTKGRR